MQLQQKQSQKKKPLTQTTEKGNPCEPTCLSKAGIIRDEKTKIRFQNEQVPLTRIASLTQVLIPHQAALLQLKHNRALRWKIRI